MHFNADHFDTSSWLQREVGYLDDFVVNALLVDVPRPRISPVGDGVLLTLKKQAIISNSMMQSAEWIIKNRFIFFRKLTTNLGLNVRKFFYQPKKCFLFLTSLHWLRHSMNKPFLRLWHFQGFNYLSECRLIDLGSSVVARCHLQSNWILLNAF